MATGVLLYNFFSEYELSVALSVLMQGSHHVVTIGLTPEAVTGEAHLRCLPDTDIRTIKSASLDSLLFPGCMDISTLLDQTDLFHFIREMAQSDVKLFAISSAPFLLAKAGVLTNRRYTVGLTREQRDLLGCFDERHYSDEPVVRDRNIITARGSAFIQFGCWIGEALELSFDPRWYGTVQVGNGTTVPYQGLLNKDAKES